MYPMAFGNRHRGPSWGGPINKRKSVKSRNPGFGHFASYLKSFRPRDQFFFRFIPTLLGSPESQLKLMGKMKFSNFGLVYDILKNGFYVLTNVLYVNRIRHSAIFDCKVDIWVQKVMRLTLRNPETEACQPLRGYSPQAPWDRTLHYRHSTSCCARLRIWRLGWPTGLTSRLYRLAWVRLGGDLGVMVD